MAQDPLPAHELEGVSITATRIERKTAEVPASVAVVDEERIKETKMSNIKEVLRGIPGVLVDTKNQGYDSRVLIRGAGLKARYGIRDVMVLLDGVPITDPDGLTRLDFIDTQLVEQVEVVKGPNSTLWGAGRSIYLKAHFNSIRGRLRKYLCYPSIARKRGWSGKVMVAFTVHPDGRADNIEIQESCGISLLDKSALKTVQNACPFPTPPMAARIIVPILYQLE